MKNADCNGTAKFYRFAIPREKNSLNHQCLYVGRVTLLRGGWDDDGSGYGRGEEIF